MKIETRGYRQNGRGEVEATLAVLGDDNGFLVEDMINLSRARERGRFARYVSKRLSTPEDWVDVQLLDLLAQVRAALDARPVEQPGDSGGQYQIVNE